MGRKIPAKKHRGVKDPVQQQARRLLSLQTKINAPPSDPDEQPVPRSLQRLFAFQQHTKEHKQTSLKRTPNTFHNKESSKVAATHNPVRGLRAAPGESGRELSRRISCAVRALHELGAHDYPEDTEAEDRRGARMRELRERRARRVRRARGPGPAGPEVQAQLLTRGQKLTLKKKAKKDKIIEAAAAAGGEVVYERVQFGAASEAPPALSAPRRATALHKAGARDLLLSAMLRPRVPSAGGPGAPGVRGTYAPGTHGPEQARLHAVAAYRALKAARRNKHNI